ncbi:chondroitin sulfate proteoglycan 5-like [Sinocyclocheilus grahami]|uniref:chondroitin sulfate proteoglycan 5-like n=1 Tax=Sinocyclocheilus grahami TaxID=75366 RepID=UPI0007AD5592|nr:PREDICTED: chondroitin sulfate proteoglycan 5-like [Sinocyclocheilus grahami]
MNRKEMSSCLRCWSVPILSVLLLVFLTPLFAHGNSVVGNETEYFDSSGWQLAENTAYCSHGSQLGQRSQILPNLKSIGIHLKSSMTRGILKQFINYPLLSNSGGVSGREDEGRGGKNELSIWWKRLAYISLSLSCRCNIQDYMWHKGARCESVITEFQVMCIAIGASALMVLLLFMIVVCFAKKLHVLKTENNKLLKRSSKYRPSSEHHNDNFSLSTIAEGSHPNVRKLCDTPPNLPHARALAYYDNIICQKTMSRYTWECKTKEEPDCEDDPNSQNKLEDPVKAPPPKEDESLNIQNSLTPKHENHKVLGEENSSEVNSLQNNMM